MHTLAFNEALRGLNAEELRYAILGPKTDIAFIDDARKRFVTDSHGGNTVLFAKERNLIQALCSAGFRRVSRGSASGMNTPGGWDSGSDMMGLRKNRSNRRSRHVTSRRFSKQQTIGNARAAFLLICRILEKASTDSHSVQTVILSIW
jgi:hypothetical protein